MKKIQVRHDGRRIADPARARDETGNEEKEKKQKPRVYVRALK